MPISNQILSGKRLMGLELRILTLIYNQKNGSLLRIFLTFIYS